MRQFSLAVLVGLAAAFATTAIPSRSSASEAGSVLIPSAKAIVWQAGPTDLPRGSRIVVLSGDPAKPGPFVLRVEFPAHTLVAQHRHATTENLTVISGSFYHGIGEKVDTAHEHLMQAGGFLYLPGGTPHYLRTTDAKTVVQVTGTGPFGLQYVKGTHHDAM